MPRLAPRLIKQANGIDRLLGGLLLECRNIESARNELRWLREHAQSIFRQRLGNATSRKPLRGWREILERFVSRRARGTPLQYIIGNQPFGELEILCRPGVLIPRTATEHYVETLCDDIERLDSHIQFCLNSVHNETAVPQYHDAKRLRILDMCTGTGCIALSAYQRLHSFMSTTSKTSVDVLGVDKSPIAVGLALRNLKHNAQILGLAKDSPSDPDASIIDFALANVFPSSKKKTTTTTTTKPPNPHIPYINDLLKAQQGSANPKCDILISNPPYISNQSYNDGTTSKSVRLHEPITALVPSLSDSEPHQKHRFNAPPPHGDEFYPALLNLATTINANLTLLEVGDTKQARNVISYIQTKIVEIVPDYDKSPAAAAAAAAATTTANQTPTHLVEVWQDEEQDQSVTEDPFGPVRAVVWWRGDWAKWRLENVRHRPSHCLTAFVQ